MAIAQKIISTGKMTANIGTIAARRCCVKFFIWFSSYVSGE